MPDRLSSTAWTARIGPAHARPRPATRAGAIALALALALALSLGGCATPSPWLTTGGADQDAVDRANAREDAQGKFHAAVQAAQPGQARLGTARRALERLLTDDDAEARAMRPYARALLEQIRERQRLASLNARLAREIEACAREGADQAQALEALRSQNGALQRKLDALTEIERQLTPPDLPPTALPGTPE